MHRSDLQQRLLPAGRLREPLASLRRAGVIVLRHEDADLEPALREHTPTECRFWRVRRSLALQSPMQRAVAFCAVARPSEFFAGLASIGAGLAEQVRFRDHHRYTVADIDRLAQLGRQVGCDGFVTTAKDEVKLDAAMRSRLNTVAPLQTAALTVQVEDERAVLDDMRKSLIVTAR
jgi:tetraacyldisaccharide 4'-kinase